MRIVLTSLLLLVLAAGSAEAKKYNILVVPGSSFGCPGYVRIAYCVSYETIVNSLPKFAELAREYK